MTVLVTQATNERVFLTTHVFFSIVASTLMFPFIMAWTWEDGWLSEKGYQDYQGAGTIHVVSGIAGFIAALITGPGIRSKFFKKDISFIFDPVNFDTTDLEIKKPGKSLKGYSLQSK